MSEVEMIRVVDVSLDGISYIDDDIPNTLLGLAHSQDGDVYEVTFYEMTKEEFESLPEFEGF
jgi:hypothetical protein